MRIHVQVEQLLSAGGCGSYALIAQVLSMQRGAIALCALWCACLGRRASVTCFQANGLGSSTRVPVLFRTRSPVAACKQACCVIRGMKRGGCLAVRECNQRFLHAVARAHLPLECMLSRCHQILLSCPGQHPRALSFPRNRIPMTWRRSRSCNKHCSTSHA